MNKHMLHEARSAIDAGSGIARGPGVGTPATKAWVPPSIVSDAPTIGKFGEENAKPQLLMPVGISGEKSQRALGVNEAEEAS